MDTALDGRWDNWRNPQRRCRNHQGDAGTTKGDVGTTNGRSGTTTGARGSLLRQERTRMHLAIQKEGSGTKPRFACASGLVLPLPLLA